MKISKHEEYGLRCILQLARAGTGNLVAVSEIAKMEGLSTQYVTKLLSKLLKSGLVNSVRGVTGGYRLAQPADKITLCEVMSSLGESFYSRDLPKLCNEYRAKFHECCHNQDCGIRPVWAMLAKQISMILSRTTLADLLKDEMEVEQVMAAKFPSPVNRF